MIASLIFLTLPNFPVFHIQNGFGSERFYEPRAEAISGLDQNENRLTFSFAFPLPGNLL